MISEQEFYTMCGLILSTDDEGLRKFIDLVYRLIDMVKEASCEDFYGTEGWKHYIGWED